MMDGQVRPVAGGAGIGIGTLIGGQRLALKVDPKAPLKDPTRYTLVGKPLPRPDVPGKCTGRNPYVQDFIVSRHAARPRDSPASDRRETSVRG